ncbi:MAG: helix-turn-helix domain-containing protein [Cephaloticoccus sp.]|nr:helix-turn-helix domain-containing protein [Cephaloticoccus sp.]MCF7759564.1 helix-turn-helix domain-containing protein [Cephaloticoccus sp.]
MKSLNQAVIQRALDKDIEVLKAASLVTKTRPTRGWLHTVRNALGLTQRVVGTKAGIKQQAFRQWEMREVKGSITLGSLKRAATAMDCDLVYFLVPKPVVATSFTDLAGRSEKEVTVGE